MMIVLGDEGVPAILFKDETGKESLALSDFLIRLGKIGEENIQIDRVESKTAITIAGRKGSGTAVIGMFDGQPSLALSDSKDLNQVGMTADEKHGEVAIMRKGEYVWQAEGEKMKGTKKRYPRRKPLGRLASARRPILNVTKGQIVTFTSGRRERLV
jgi:hypothetical protein